MEKYLYYFGILCIVATAFVLFISYKRVVYLYKKEMDRNLKPDGRRALADINDKIYTTLRNFKFNLENDNSIQIQKLRELAYSIYTPVMSYASRRSLKILSYILYSLLSINDGNRKNDSDTATNENDNIIDCICILCAYTLLYIQIKAEACYKRDKPIFLYCIFFTDNIIESNKFYYALIKCNNQIVKELKLGCIMHIDLYRVRYL